MTHQNDPSAEAMVGTKNGAPIDFESDRRCCRHLSALRRLLGKSTPDQLPSSFHSEFGKTHGNVPILKSSTAPRWTLASAPRRALDFLNLWADADSHCQ